MRTLILALLASAALVSAAAAQPAESMDDQLARVTTVMDEAQAAAARPGDEALTCEQLQTELGATMTDPQVQQTMAANGVIAQGQLDRANSARNAAMGLMIPNMIMGFASSFIPGGGYLQQGAMAAQAAQMRSQQAQADQQRQAMLDNMVTVMPQLMRGQRVMELAQTKQCAWVNEAMAQQQR